MKKPIFAVLTTLVLLFVLRGAPAKSAPARVGEPDRASVGQLVRIVGVRAGEPTLITVKSVTLADTDGEIAAEDGTICRTLPLAAGADILTEDAAEPLDKEALSALTDALFVLTVAEGKITRLEPFALG